jgi:hypothetical protein
VSLIESPKMKMASYDKGLAFEKTFSKKPHANMIPKRMKIFIALWKYIKGLVLMCVWIQDWSNLYILTLTPLSLLSCNDLYNNLVDLNCLAVYLILFKVYTAMNDDLLC